VRREIEEVAPPSRKILVAQHHCSHPHECPHDLDVDPHGSIAVQHTGQHRDTLFREGEWQELAMPPPPLHLL
jgi:hypothetical protein